MKKIYIIAIISLFSTSLLAQNASDGTNKKVQIGIGLGGGALFYKMGTDRAEKDGAGYNFHLGLDLNYNFAEHVGLYTGLSFDLEGFKYKFDASDRIFYNYDDKEVLGKEDIVGLTDYDSLLITNRTYKPIYLTIPTMLVFKTDQIGYLKYFGKFGLRTSFLLSQKGDDTGYKNGIIAETIEQKNIKYNNDLLAVKSSVGIAGGVEWNFTGSTVLVGEIGFYYGFLNTHVSKSVGGDTERNYSLYQNVNGAPEYNPLKSNQMQLLFRLAVLF
jgi:hypothetical protein